MKFGIVGLGRIGGALARQALDKGHTVVGYNRSPDKTRALARHGLQPVFSYEELAQALDAPRVALVYVPHGSPTHEVVMRVADAFEAGDVIVDGGNSHWRDSKRHHAGLARRGIGFVDAGTSGGVEGARTQACFMAGGIVDDVRLAEPILRALAAPGGYFHAGPPGAGHFTKLIHNAIEFGMVQALAEGVELVERSDEYDVDLADLAHCWAHGSVIRGWLVELLEAGLRQEQDLGALSDYVEDTKEGKWYVEYALERDAYAPVVSLSQMMFSRYRDRESVAAKAVALLRHGFGGHPLRHRETRPIATAPDPDASTTQPHP